jgi:WD40 repeat protein
MAAQHPETILIFAANPSGQPQLRLDHEVREIQNGLRHSRKHFEVRHVWATRPQDLRRSLLDHKPLYVHFCGHGAGAAGIVLEGHLVAADALAGLFALFSDRIKCVVLNACYSSIQAHAIVQHIDYVVGMSKSIGDSAAIEFSTAFYDALGAGESVEFAFALGCNAIQLIGIPEHLTPQLLTRATVAPSSAPSAVPATQETTHRDWDGAPAVSQLYGRDADAELLRSWILGESCRVVLITGLGGVGKTDLVTCLGRGGNQSEGTSATLAAGIHEHFDAVIWRSLLNVPPPEDLFGDMVAVLSEHRRTLRPLPHQQIEDVLRCLQERRCLVILDNVEAVLKPGDPQMRYREGYEAYGAFFEQAGRSTHKSCLLLTSREKPRAVADLEGAHKPVRSLSLAGIGKAESQSLFAQIGAFSGRSTDWDRIVRLYNGNPLALELAARHIDQVFDGDLGAFLGIGRPVIADLEELLDWHLNRLSQEEQELVYWLAIEREPVNLVVLYDNLVSTRSRQNTASTLQSLQRRIPLERAGNGSFALQPVLIEHITARLVSQIVDGFERAVLELPDAGGPSPGSLLVDIEALRVFNTYALIKATARENVRESQRRLILAPVAERLYGLYGKGLKTVAAALLDAWRRDQSGEFSYAAGNLVNLLSYLAVSVSGLNFSRLPVWQACLHDVNLHSTDFSFCGFRHDTFKHPFGSVFSLCYSPDGESIAVGDDNGEVHLFSASTGQFDTRFVGHTDVVWAIAFSPEGHLMASASFDGTIRVWSPRDGRCVNVLIGHRGWVYALAFSPDGRTLASASEDGTCRVWNVGSGISVVPAVEETGFLAAVAFSPDGQMLAVAGSSQVVSLFHLSDLQTPFRLVRHEARVRALAFSAQGDLLVSGGEDSQIHLWHARDGAYLGTFLGHAAGITALSFSSTGDILASASLDHTVRLWSTERRECVGQLRVASARVWSVQCSPTDRTLATGSEDGAVRVWSLDTCECLMTLRGYSNKTLSLAFAPDRSLLLAANEDGVVRAWNVPEARTELELRGHASRVWAVACSVDGRWVASASDDLSVRLWELGREVCRHVMQGHTDWIRGLAFDPVSQRLASGGEDGRVLVWDVDSGTLVRDIDSGTNRIFAVAFCDGGRCIAAAGAGNAVHLFSAADGSRIGELAGHEGWISALVPLDGVASTLASCSEDGTVRTWDLTRRRCTRTLVVGSQVWSGAFCDGGQSFVSGSEDGTLRRWALGSGCCEQEARAHEGAVWSLALDAAQNTVATAGTDGSIRLWRLASLAPDPALGTLRPARPYEGMNITGATGLMAAQRTSLLSLGAISFPSSP